MFLSFFYLSLTKAKHRELRNWIRNTNKDVIAKIILCWKETLGLPTYALVNSDQWPLPLYLHWKFTDLRIAMSYVCRLYNISWSSPKIIKDEHKQYFLFKKSINYTYITITLHLYCMFISTSCGQVVRDFEREAKTRCNFSFR